MVLDQTRETVLSWFDGKEYNDVRVMTEVLLEHGYTVEEVDSPGAARGVRRIVGLISDKYEDGHAVVMDDDESIVDPKSKATTKKTLLDYWATGYRVGRVFVITRNEA
jgi:hypothetical protein